MKAKLRGVLGSGRRLEKAVLFHVTCGYVFQSSADHSPMFQSFRQTSLLFSLE